MAVDTDREESLMSRYTDVLPIVLVVVGVVDVIAVVGLAFFFGFQKPDPTKAKMPDHSG